MNMWKLGGAALAGAMVATALLLTVGLRGQERSAAERAADRAAQRELRLAQWTGAQIGVTVSEAQDGDGVVVEDVRENSPAEKAGVRSGDVITEFDGERVRSTRQFSRLVDETPVGRTVAMVIQRADRKNTVKVVPETRQFGRIAPLPLERFRIPELPDVPRVRPEIELFAARAGRLGVQIEDLEGQLASYFGVKRGVLVTSVASDSPAERAGIKAGDVITAVGGEAVDDSADLRRELRRAGDEELSIDLTRDRKPVSVKVKLRARTPTPTSWPLPAAAPPA